MRSASVHRFAGEYRTQRPAPREAPGALCSGTIAATATRKDVTRAIGTFIPKSNPDGTPNPVITTVLKGETFRGRAYVVNQWYITAYEPILDENNRVMGVLYVGIPQERVASLREAVMAAQVGKTGYVYVLDSKGNYVISHGGKRDGESIYGARTPTGRCSFRRSARRRWP